MKKSTKKLWIYITVLFSIAIVLILVTTFTQSKIVDNDGNLSVLGSLTATSKEKIVNLQNENANLKAELEAVKTENIELKSNAETALTASTEQQRLKEQVASLYKAYTSGDHDKMKELISQLTKEQIDERIPGLYDKVQNALNE